MISLPKAVPGEEWLRHLYEQSRAALPELPEFDEFRKQGIFKT